MVTRKTALPLALIASAALAVPGAHAAGNPTGPVAHAAGSGAPPLNPAVVGNAIIRTDAALGSAADFIDLGDGASAAKPLTAARRYLIRSYTGAKYLIAHPPPAPADAGSANPARFVAQARRLVRRSRQVRKADRWVRAHASEEGPAPPAIADNPTAVFNVLTSQYSAAIAAVAMYPDTTGTLQQKVKLVLNTSIILRNRLVKVGGAAEPPAPAEEGRVHAHASGNAVAGVTYAPVMPGLIVLLDDEIQAMTAAKSSLPAAAQSDFDAAIAADQKIEALVNTDWPPAPADWWSRAPPPPPRARLPARPLAVGVCGSPRSSRCSSPWRRRPAPRI